VTGTPLVIYAFNRKSNGDCRPEHAPPQLAGNEVAYVSSKTDKSD
jgi:hypothetical protein